MQPEGEDRAKRKSQEATSDLPSLVSARTTRPSRTWEPRSCRSIVRSAEVRLASNLHPCSLLALMRQVCVYILHQCYAYFLLRLVPLLYIDRIPQILLLHSLVWISSIKGVGVSSSPRFPTWVILKSRVTCSHQRRFMSLAPRAAYVSVSLWSAEC